VTKVRSLIATMKGLIEEDNENLGSNLACKLSNSLRAIC